MHADVVLTGGRVFAGLATDAPQRHAVAVRDGGIVAVGDPADVAGLIGPGTEVVDTTGMLVVPGFHDAHVHPVQAGVELLQCDLTGTLDAEDCLRRVADYAATHPDEPWIVGAGWSME